VLDSGERQVVLKLLGHVFTSIIGVQSLDGVLPVFFKKGMEKFETMEHVAFSFHRVDREGFGAIVDKSGKVFIAFP
jgi:hypothetical protein